MYLLAKFLRFLDVVTVAFIVSALNDICRNRPATILGKFRRDIVARWALRLFNTPPYQALHIFAVGLQNAGVVGLGELGRGQPENVLYRILDPNSADIDPFGRGRHLRRIVPKELLAQLEAHFITQRQQQAEVVEGPNGAPGVQLPPTFKMKLPCGVKTRLICSANGKNHLTYSF